MSHEKNDNLTNFLKENKPVSEAPEGEEQRIFEAISGRSRSRVFRLVPKVALPAMMAAALAIVLLWKLPGTRSSYDENSLDQAIVQSFAIMSGEDEFSLSEDMDLGISAEEEI